MFRKTAAKARVVGRTRKQSATKDELADAAVMGNAERDEDADELLKCREMQKLSVRVVDVVRKKIWENDSRV